MGDEDKIIGMPEPAESTEIDPQEAPENAPDPGDVTTDPGPEEKGPPPWTEDEEKQAWQMRWGGVAPSALEWNGFSSGLKAACVAVGQDWWNDLARTGAMHLHKMQMRTAQMAAKAQREQAQMNHVLHNMRPPGRGRGPR